jgi:hypothetical protein
MSAGFANIDAAAPDETYPQWIYAVVALAKRESELSALASARPRRDEDPPPGPFDHHSLNYKLVRRFLENSCLEYYREWLTSISSPPRDPPPEIELAALHSVHEALTSPPGYFSFMTAEEQDELRELRARVRRDVKDRQQQLEQEPPGAFGELRTFAVNSLKGNQRKVVETICDNDGSCRLADMALALGWHPSFSGKRFNEYKNEINPKLRDACLTWRLRRRDNCAQAYRTAE